MATATTKIITSRTYVLTLTEEEARTLKTVTNCIGGIPETTLRRCTDAIGAALREEGVEPYNTDEVLSDRDNRIYFKR